VPTFSEEVKMSIVNTEFLYPEIELYGAIKGKGDFVIDGNKKYLKISVSSLSSMKRVYKLCKKLFGEWITAYVRVERRLRIGRTGEILLDLRYSEKIISNIGIDIFEDKVPEILKEDPIKLGVFLKGMFLTTGSVSLKSSYHLEFFLDISEKYANDLINTFKELLGVKANYIIKSNKIKLYIKASRDIVSLLEIMGANESVEKLMDIVKVRELKGNVTRTINFITANALKTAESSSKQIKEIEYIIKNIGLESLNEELRKIAEYRINNSDESLSEMAESLGYKKSTLYSKLKKISKIAQELKNNGGNKQ